MKKGQGLAVGAGLFGAAASVFAKLAMEATTLIRVCPVALDAFSRRMGLGHSDHNAEDYSVTADLVDVPSAWATSGCESMLLFIRVACFLFVFLCNSFMWTLYTKSLLYHSASVVATVTNTASNFFFTAVCGWLIFGEELPLLWWVGAALIVLGLLIIHRSSSDPSLSELLVDKEKIS